jgi:transposase
MERIVQRPGALDVHKESVTACVRVWEGRELKEHMAEFQTTVQGLLALRDWLEALGVSRSRWRPPACIGGRCGRSWRIALR